MTIFNLFLSEEVKPINCFHSDLFNNGQKSSKSGNLHLVFEVVTLLQIIFGHPFLNNYAFPLFGDEFCTIKHL